MTPKFLNRPPPLLLAQTLRDLIRKQEGLTPAQLARTLGIPTNKITRILNGDVTDPKVSTLLHIAPFFGININQLLGIESIGREGNHRNLIDSYRVPVFNLQGMEEQKPPKEWYRWGEKDLEGTYYALCVDTDLYEPPFVHHSLLIVQADLIPEERCFVIVKKKNKCSYGSIKKWVIDGTEPYLYLVNPKLSVEGYDEKVHTIAGVIVEVHQKVYLKNKR